MYLFVEKWKARPEWLALSQQEREEYVSKVGHAIKDLLKAGIEIMGFALNDPDTPHRADYRYFSVWKLPDKELVQKFEQAIEQSGWYQYFEQTNARGEFVQPDAALGDMINL